MSEATGMLRTRNDMHAKLTELYSTIEVDADGVFAYSHLFPRMEACAGKPLVGSGLSYLVASSIAQYDQRFQQLLNPVDSTLAATLYGRIEDFFRACTADDDLVRAATVAFRKAMEKK